MPKITEMYAFIGHEPRDPEDEGILGFMGDQQQWIPMIGADMDRVDSLRLIADKICALEGRGRVYKVLRFKLEGEIE